MILTKFRLQINLCQYLTNLTKASMKSFSIFDSANTTWAGAAHLSNHQKFDNLQT